MTRSTITTEIHGNIFKIIINIPWDEIDHHPQSYNRTPPRLDAAAAADPTTPRKPRITCKYDAILQAREELTTRRKAARAAMRRRAVQLHQAGATVKQVAAAIGRRPSTVYQWLRQARNAGTGQ